MALLVASHVTMDFGATRAVDDVSLAVEPGEVVGLLGANGAGKTTLIRIVLGLLAPTRGSVELLGGPPGSSTRRDLGSMPQGLGLYDDLTVAENLRFQAAAFGAAHHVPAGLVDVADVVVADLPLGARRRVAFAAALGHDPKVLVLDEPTSGVGPLGRADLWDTIHGAADDGVGVLVTTHYMDEAAQCDRLVILARGSQVAGGTPREVVGERRVVEVASHDPDVMARLEEAGMVVLPVASGLRVVGAGVADVAGTLGDTAVEVTVAPATLEEAFIDAVHRTHEPA